MSLTCTQIWQTRRSQIVVLGAGVPTSLNENRKLAGQSQNVNDNLFLFTVTYLMD